MDEIFGPGSGAVTVYVRVCGLMRSSVAYELLLINIESVAGGNRASAPFLAALAG